MTIEIGGEKASRECPNCRSRRNWKDGIRETTLGYVQRYICRDCDFRFSEKPYKEYELTENNQLCVILQDAKKLDTATEIKTVAGESKESTYLSRDRRLRRLVNLGADLSNPESVKETIAKQERWKESMKEVAVFAYDLFAKWMGLKWERPRYKAIRELPFIPQEREIDDVIAGCNEEIVLLIQIGKETGARAGEIFAIKWTNIDFERKSLQIIAEKGSNPRIFKLSNKLFDRLNSLPKPNERIFNHYSNLNNLRRTYERQRNRTAQRLRNPRLKKITFHTLRHWKGTTEYHKTKDLLHVQQILGHKNVKNTLLYIQLASVEEPESQFICKVAKEPKEIQDLIEQNFQFVCSQDGLAYFKKLK